MSVTVNDIMTRRVVAVRQEATYKELAAQLVANRVSAFPVIDEAGTVVGVVSEADLLVKEAGLADPAGPLPRLRLFDRAKAAGANAGELMTTPPVTIGPDASVEQAALRMYTRRVKRLPVVHGTGRLAGIVSRADVLSVFRRPDQKIAREISDEVIVTTFLAPRGSIQVTVIGGIVTLAGRPETDPAGHRIIDAVRHVEGVVAVRDRLTYSGRMPTIPVPI